LSDIRTWLGQDVCPLHATNDILIDRFPPGFTANVMTAITNRRPVERE
jgi:hypothetical protein